MKNNPKGELHIVLIEPEIPQNTGNIGRLSLGIGAKLHLVKPLGFDVSEKAVRRAGLDYWRDVDLQIHESTDDFLHWAKDKQLFLMSTKANTSLADAKVKFGDSSSDVVLVFGPETRGLSEEIRSLYPCFRIPMKTQIRSYNLSNSVAIASYFMLQQISPDWMRSS